MSFPTLSSYNTFCGLPLFQKNFFVIYKLHIFENMVENIDRQQITAVRLYNSGLCEPFGSIETCAERLFGIQAQAQQFAEISVLNRVADVTRQKLKELYESHRLIKIWGQRMTVHMYSASDWKYINSIYADRNNFIKRGWEGNEDILGRIMREIDERGRKSRRLDKNEIENIIETHASHIENEYRDYSIMHKATLDGIIFGVPDLPHTTSYGHISLCASGDKCRGKEEAMENLIIRYFESYGPASFSDFLHWSGLTKKEAQPGFDCIKEKLTEHVCGGKSFYTVGDPRNAVYDGLFMLGKFDPLLVCYSDKSWIADPARQKAVWQSAARVEAVIVSGTELAGTWRHTAKGKNIEFNIAPFKNFNAREKKQIKEKSEKIARFMDKKLTGVNFI